MIQPTEPEHSYLEVSAIPKRGQTMKVDTKNDLTAYLNAISQAVKGQPGKLILASYGQDPVTGKDLKPMVEHYAQNDIQRLIRTALHWTQMEHRNVYMPLVLMNPELKTGKKGGLADIQSVFGLCADFDDNQAHRWKERLPVTPSFVLETSKGRYQAFYLFEKPVKPETVKALAVDLKKYSNCDHGTKDLCHVWRLPGTLNRPNKKKVDAGRHDSPQEVKIAQGFTGLTDINTLRDKLPKQEPAKAERQAPRHTTPPPVDIADLSDNDLLEKAFRSKKGTKIRQLYNGEWSDYLSHSDADQALCNHLAFWLDRDPGRIDAAFRSSGLMREEKWDKKHFSNGQTYGQGTISKAISGTTETYQGFLTEKAKSKRKQSKAVPTSKFSARVFSEALLKKYNLRSDRYKRFWFYNKDIGLWTENAEQILEFALRKGLLSEEYLSRYYVREVLSDTKSLVFDLANPAEPAPELIPFKNGIFNLSRDNLEAYKPELFFTNQLPVKYKPDASCPLIDQIFSELVADPDILFELCAYCLCRSYQYAKWFFLYGSGGNGKSLFTNILAMMLGHENVKSLTPHDLQNNRFASAGLFGKLANIAGEISYQKLEKTDVLKRLVGGDLIRGERKFKDAFYFQNYAKLIFNTNELPKTYDQTRAFYRRLYLVEFPNRFEGKLEDKSLISKITKKELEGLTVKSLKYLKAFIDRGYYFASDASVEELQAKYTQLTNPLNVFLSEHAEFDANGYIAKWEFKDKFTGWLQEKGYRIWNNQEITQGMKSSEVEEKHKDFEGKRWRAWVGLKWKKQKSDHFDHFEQQFTPKETIFDSRDSKGVDCFYSRKIPVKVVKVVTSKNVDNISIKNKKTQLEPYEEKYLPDKDCGVEKKKTELQTVEFEEGVI